MRVTPKLLPARSGNLGILTLNNPNSFHALTTDMIFALQDVLHQFYSDETLQGILLKSTGSPAGKTPAFCAGGDVKQVYTSGLEHKESVVRQRHGIGLPGLGTSEFFRHEYDVNYQMAIHKDTVPQVSLWDGIVMGGGVGISIHGKYRVATEHSIWSMPETSIGLFPDVGSTWWMPRLLAPSLAVYLALTGQRLYPADLLYAGLATHYIPSTQLPELETALAHSTKEDIAQVLLSFHENPTTDPLNSALASNRGWIDRLFLHALDPPENSKQEGNGGNHHHNDTTIERAIDALKASDTEFASSTLQVLQSVSPTSLKVTLEGLRRGSQLHSIQDAFAMEFRMSQAFVRNHDFYEGVRARLVDKDNLPQWDPPHLKDVTPEMVASYFDPVEYEWEPSQPVARM